MTDNHVSEAALRVIGTQAAFLFFPLSSSARRNALISNLRLPCVSLGARALWRGN